MLGGGELPYRQEYRFMMMIGYLVKGQWIERHNMVFCGKKWKHGVQKLKRASDRRKEKHGGEMYLGLKILGPYQ